MLTVSNYSPRPGRCTDDKVVPAPEDTHHPERGLGVADIPVRSSGTPHRRINDAAYIPPIYGYCRLTFGTLDIGAELPLGRLLISPALASPRALGGASSYLGPPLEP